MTIQRLIHIKSAALRAKRSLDRFGSLRRNRLPLVSIFEHKELMRLYPNLARYTRSFRYDDSVYIDDVNRMGDAKLPTVKEFWVGARSLGCVASDELTQQMADNQQAQEDAAELTDLQTMLYHDPVAYDNWVESEITRRILNERGPSGGRRWGSKYVKNHIIRQHMRAKVMLDVPTDRDGDPVKVMLTDDETGELRPVRNGDMIQYAHGSNEDLDALYMDEPLDPRAEDDSRIRVLLRDQVMPNSDFEQDMLNDRHMRLPSKEDYRVHDEQQLRLMAAVAAEHMIERDPGLEPRFAAMRFAMYRRLKRQHMAFKQREDQPTEGMFVTPAHIWADAEEHVKRLAAHHARKERVKPGPVDWELIRKR